MKKLLRVATSLLFLSAAGWASADEAALQTDKQDLSAKVSNDQTGVDKADDKMGGDKSAIDSDNDDIKSVKRRMNSHYENLLKDRAELKDAKAKGDEAEIKAKVEDIRRDHHAMYKDSVKLERARASRKKEIGDLKDDRDNRDSDVSKLDSNGQDLNKTNEKIADQKQDSASK
jgi:chromosome segregation ATPase